MTPTRKMLVGWALGMAAALSGLVALVMIGSFSDLESALMLFVLIAACTILPVQGVGFAVGAMDRRAGNPPIVWVAVIWNCLILGTLTILVFVGLMAG